MASLKKDESSLTIKELPGIRGEAVTESDTPQFETPPKAYIRSTGSLDATSTMSQANPTTQLSSRAAEEQATRIARRHTLRVIGGFVACFTTGWADGVTGVVLPYVKQQFNLSYTLSALPFVAVATGYVITAFTMERSTNHLGRFRLSSPHRPVMPLLLPIPASKRTTLGFSLMQGRCFLMMLATCVHMAFFLTVASSKTFGGVWVGFFLNGFAKGNLITSLNAYMIANPKTFSLSHMHSFFCIGALTSPLLCQSLIAKGWKWQRFYYLSSALPVITLFVILFTFRPERAEYLLDKERASQISGPQHAAGLPLQVVRRGEVPVDVESMNTEGQASRHSLPRNMFMTAIKTPATWVFGFFVSMYTGSEGVTSGYIVTYLLRTKGANPSQVGYANSAFWAGAAFGRAVFGYAAPYMGKLKPYWIFLLLTLAISFHLCIWLSPSFPVGWGMTALVGMTLGPVFPLSLEVASKALSPAVMSSSLAIMTSLGNVGGAFFPFLTGLLSNAKGPRVIEPLVVSLLSSMFCFWGVTRLQYPFK